MIRPEYFVYPPIKHVLPKPAVTLIWVREAVDGEGFEVLLSRRASSSRFAPGVFVFPGGGIEPLDAQAASQTATRAQQDAQQATFAAAAIRESFEEVGLLLARDARGQWVSGAAIARAGLARQAPLLPQLQKLGWRLAVDAIYEFAHWTTGRSQPQRYAVPFLIAWAPPAQEAVADEVEQFSATWIHPAKALERSAGGEMPMVLPTLRTLQRLASFSSPKALMQACEQAPVMPPSCPHAGLLNGEQVRYTEEDAEYGELQLVCPNGEDQHELAWQHECAVPLLRHVQRLTAPNASSMTGPGTNTYLIGEPSAGYIVLDPGPNDINHLQRIMALTSGDVRQIVCTHSHPDHSPGALPLQTLVFASQRAKPPICGMASGPHARPDSFFRPNRALQAGDTVKLASTSVQHTLQTIYTPGHAANHLCFLLQEDGIVFCGDHILGGSTTVVIPPDGNMQQYLDALDTLDALCEIHAIEFLLPAHGHVLANARKVIALLKEHRLQREAKVLAAVQSLPAGSIDDWLAQAYADTPRKLWPVARHSLLAHLERLAQLHPGLPVTAHAKTASQDSSMQ